MTVRIATPADATRLSELHRAAFDEGWSGDDFTTWLARAEGFAVIAESNREAVAFGLALAAGADAELLTIAVHPGHRRAGWGRRIFHVLDTQAASRGLQRWVLEVARNNLAALALYKSEGFVEIGVRKAYYKTREGQIDALALSREVGLGRGQDSA